MSIERGRPRSFGEAAAQYFSRVHAYIFSRWRNRQEVDDLAQEVYLRLLKADYLEEEVRYPLGLLCRIANCVMADKDEAARKYLRVGEALESRANSLSKPSERPEDNLSMLQLLSQVMQAGHSLSPKHFEAWILCKVHKMTHKEAARELHLRPNTVGSYVKEANQYIKRELQRIKEWR